MHLCVVADMYRVQHPVNVLYLTSGMTECHCTANSYFERTRREFILIYKTHSLLACASANEVIHRIIFNKKILLIHSLYYANTHGVTVL